MESRHQRSSRQCFLLYVVLAMIMDNKNNVCFGAPVHSEDTRSNSSSSSTSRSSAPVLDIEDPAQVINATDLEAAEQQGDEFADLQALRAGLGVLNTIAVSFAVHAPPAPPIFTQHNARCVFSI